MGRHRGKARRYTGRPKLDESHILVQRAETALLELIRRCRNVKWTIVAAPPSPTVVFRDKVVGMFTHKLLLPDFENGVATATALLAAQKAEWRKPLGPWRSRAVDEETAEPVPDADEAEEAAAAATGSTAADEAGT